MESNDLNLERVINKYSELIYRTAFLLLNSKSDAEDIVQEVFLKYFRNNKGFVSEEHEKAWLIRVTKNCSLNLKKSAWMRKKVELNENIVFKNDSENELYEYLKKLDANSQIILQLFYFEGFTIKEISRILEISQEATKVRLSRARKKLKKIMEGGKKDD